MEDSWNDFKSGWCFEPIIDLLYRRGISTHFVFLLFIFRIWVSLLFLLLHSIPISHTLSSCCGLVIILSVFIYLRIICSRFMRLISVSFFFFFCSLLSSSFSNILFFAEIIHVIIINSNLHIHNKYIVRFSFIRLLDIRAPDNFGEQHDRDILFPYSHFSWNLVQLRKNPNTLESLWSVNWIIFHLASVARYIYSR